MYNPRIGTNLPSSCETPDSLQKALGRIANDGFDVAEVSLHTFPLIIGGKIVDDYVGWLKKQLNAFPLSYSAHIDGAVDLRSEDNFELNKQVLFSSIEICSMLGMNPLVLHFEVKSPNSEIEGCFFSAHREAADYAGERGVTLCMENTEVERVDPVVQMVKTMDHPSFKLCLDVGHAYLAADYFSFNFIEAVKSAADCIGHVHMSDNTGIFEPLRVTNRPQYDALSKNYRYAFGRGDIHAPPLWGTIPYEDVLAIIGGKRCIYLCEYYSERFLPFNRSVQEKVREKLNLLG